MTSGRDAGKGELAVKRDGLHVTVIKRDGRRHVGIDGNRAFDLGENKKRDEETDTATAQRREKEREVSLIR